MLCKVRIALIQGGADFPIFQIGTRRAGYHETGGSSSQTGRGSRIMPAQGELSAQQGDFSTNRKRAGPVGKRAVGVLDDGRSFLEARDEKASLRRADV